MPSGPQQERVRFVVRGRASISNRLRGRSAVASADPAVVVVVWAASCSAAASADSVCGSGVMVGSGAGVVPRSRGEDREKLGASRKRSMPKTPRQRVMFGVVVMRVSRSSDVSVVDYVRDVESCGCLSGNDREDCTIRIVLIQF